MEKKKGIFIFVLLSLIIFAMIFVPLYKEFQNKWYVKFEGKYYDVIGAVTYEENIGEVVGEIKRITPRTFWNKDGDSNFSFEGARIAIVSDGDYAVEMKIYMADTGETVSHFWMMRDPDELKK